MRRQALLATLVAASLLAGCAAPQGDPETSNPDAAPATAAPSAPDAMPTDSPGERRAILDASVADAAAPLEATFALDAVGKGPGTAWELSFGDGSQAAGTALPFRATHRYTGSGEPTARLTVRFGDGAVEHAAATLRLAAAPPAPALPTQGFHAEGLIVLGTYAPGLPECGLVAALDEQVHTWTITSDVPAQVESVKVRLSVGPTSLASDLHLYGPRGTELGSGSANGEVTIGADPSLGPGESEITATGPFPLGNYTFIVRGCMAAATSYTLDATATLVPA